MFVALVKQSSVNSDITRYTKKFGQDSKELILLAGDCLYLGGRVPFNHAYVKLKAPSLTDTAFTVSLYNSTEFIEVGRLTDATDGLTQDGIIEFAPKENESWQSKDSTDIDEIEDIQYLNLYWVKIEFLADVTIDLDFIGHKFSNDFDLFAEMPELNNQRFFNNFSQESYDKQATIAAELIESSLIRLGYAESNLQVLQWEDLTLASVSKVAQLIYSTFGNTYVDNVNSLKAEFNARMSGSFPLIDTNETAEKSSNNKMTIKTLYR